MAIEINLFLSPGTLVPWWYNFCEYHDEIALKTKTSWKEYVISILPPEIKYEYGKLTFQSEEDYLAFILKWS